MFLSEFNNIREILTKLCPIWDKQLYSSLTYLAKHQHGARRSGAEVAGWTLDRKIRVRFPAYTHRVWALWWQGGKRRLQTSWCPCQGRLGTLKTPSCPWRGCPATGQNLETGRLSCHYIAEMSLNVTLNHNQHQQPTWNHPYNGPLQRLNPSVVQQVLKDL